MLNEKNREPNFIEKRRQWNSKVQKPFSRRTLLIVLPALILSVFVLMAAPYLKLMVEEFAKGGTDMSYPAELNLEEKQTVEKEGPPPSPEAVLRQDFREKLEAEGFDWTKKPELEGPDLSFAEEQPLDLKPVEVELPNTMTELRAGATPAETPSE